MKKNNFSEIKHKIENKSVFLKIHSRDNMNIYAFSDPELIGKTLKSEKLSFYVNPTFYQEGAELIPLIQALNLMKSQINSNIIGRLAYYAAKLDIINSRSILWIYDEKSKNKIPHVFTMKTS